MKTYLLILITLNAGYAAVSSPYSSDSLELHLLSSEGPEKIEILIELAEKYKDSLPEKSFGYASLASDLLVGLNGDTLRLEFNFRIGKIMHGISKYFFALHHLQMALEVAKSVQDTTNIIDLNSFIGKIYLKAGDYNLSLKHLQNALLIAESKGDIEQEVTALNEIGLVNYHIGNYGKALEYLNKALEHEGDISNRQILVSIYNDLGLVYDDLEDFDKSLNFHFKSLEIAREIEDFRSVSYSLNNIGLVYISSGKYEHAYDYYIRSLEIKERENDLLGIASAQINISNALFRLGKYDKAIQYVKQSEELAKRLKLKTILRYVYEMYFELYEAMGNYELALANYKKSIKYKEAIFSQSKANQISEIQMRYESEKRAKEYELLKQKEKYRNFIRRILVAGIGILVLIFGIVVWIVLLKRRKDIIINRKEKLLLQAELEKNEMVKREMQSEIEFKTKQLTTHALNMMQKNKILSGLEDKIDEIMKVPSRELKRNLEKLRNQLKQSLNTRKDWELFKMYFEQVNEDFFNILIQINPALNKYDLRHCALIKLNLNIKEGASVLNVSPHTVKSARYRLKKKLNLGPEDDLNDFIRNITSSIS